MQDILLPVRLAAALVTLVAATAWAVAGHAQTDAGPGPSADSTAEGDAGPQASPEDAPGPAQLLVWNREQQQRLEAEIAALDGRIATWTALSADDVEPEAVAGELEIDLSSPSAVAGYIAALAAERRSLAIMARDKAAQKAALQPRVAPDPPPRRRRRPAPDPRSPEEIALAAAQLETLNLQIAELERRVALVTAQGAYLELSQPARRRLAEQEHEELQRQIDNQIKQAEKTQREAEAARDQALSEKRQALSEAEAAISAERARLQDIKARQGAFRKQLLEQRRRLGASRVRMDHFLSSLSRQLEIEPRYLQVFAELTRARASALTSNLALWRDRPAPTPGDRLMAEVRQLPADSTAELTAQRAALEEQRQSLAAEGRTLSHEQIGVAEERAEHDYQQVQTLNNLRIELLDQLDRRAQGERMGFSQATLHELEGEAVHVAIGAMNWASIRYQALSHLGTVLTDFSVVLAALWWLIEIPIVLFLLRFTLRRWDAWMLGIIEVVGSSMHLDRWTMLFVRLADFARNFGPALLVLLASMFVYHRLGGIDAPPEIRLVYIFIFWIAAFRFQLRLVQSVARYFGARAVERANEPAENEDQLEHNDVEEEEEDAPAVDGVSAAALPEHKHLDVTPPAPASELVTRTWRVVSGYIAVVVLLLDLVALAIGPAVLYGLIARFAWWGALPLAIYLLRAWRGHIVDAYTAHWSEQSHISQMTRRHSQRFYGVAVVAFALVITLARRLAQLTKRRLSDRDTTKRVLSFFFQRRVQAHAAEHGRVLDRPHELPKILSRCFPMGPLAAEDKPLKLRLLDEIKETFAVWQQERVDGSLVLVGGTGMGKSTALTLLEDELDTPVLRCRLDQKYTDPSELIVRLAEIFDVGDVMAEGEQSEGRPCDEPARNRAPRVAAEESAFITHLTAKLAEDNRQIVAIDDCHNLFLRQVGGFNAWEAFTRIVNASADHIFWILTFNDVAWDYLRSIAGGVSYFRKTVVIPSWSHEDLRRLILSRMRRSGFRTNFIDLLVTRLEGVKTSAQIIRTSQGYFRLLCDFAGGNPRVASHFWLRSLVPDATKRRARVHLFSAPNIEDLEKLPDDIAFVLAAVVEHENLTAAELAMVSNFSPEFCRFALRYCRERGYMFRSQGTGRTKVSTYWQQTIVRYLKRKHLLYS